MPESTTVPLLDTALEGELDALLDLPADARAAALAQLARQQPERAQALRRWLAAIDASGGLLESTEWPPTAPQRIGPWQLDGLLGRGGNGEVYLGRRADGAFEREVAIKLLRADRDSAALITEERRLLARLLHPNIAGLLDGGLSPTGAPIWSPSACWDSRWTSGWRNSSRCWGAVWRCFWRWARRSPMRTRTASCMPT